MITTTSNAVQAATAEQVVVIVGAGIAGATWR
jgi:hypothetical protein